MIPSNETLLAGAAEMTIEATYHGEVRVVRSSYTSKTGPTITLALHDIDELNKVQGMDGKRYMLALVEIGDDEQPVPSAAILEKPKGGPLAKLAGMWCNDPRFIEWIRPQYDMLMGGDGSGWGDVTPDHDFDGSNVDWAKHAVLVLCGCDESRAELDSSTEKANLFQSRIRGPYMKHLASIGLTA